MESTKALIQQTRNTLTMEPHHPGLQLLLDALYNAFDKETKQLEQQQNATTASSADSNQNNQVQERVTDLSQKIGLSKSEQRRAKRKLKRYKAIIRRRKQQQSNDSFDLGTYQALLATVEGKIQRTDVQLSDSMEAWRGAESLRQRKRLQLKIKDLEKHSDELKQQATTLQNKLDGSR